MTDTTDISRESLVDDSSNDVQAGYFAFPASLAQTRFWELDRQVPGNPAYNVAVRFRIEGELDVARLEHAFNAMIIRHEVLRATFRMVDGQLEQVIAPFLEIAIPVADLRELPSSRREIEADRLSVEEAQRSFDVAAGPLIRAGLIRMEDAQHILLVTTHHLVSDGWSVGLITNEIGEIYEALTLERQPSLPDLPIQYTDFAVWQSDWLKDSSLGRQLAYWNGQLRGLPTITIPTDRPRPATRRFQGMIVSQVLPRELTDALQQLATQNESTFFVVVLSTFKLFLHLWSKQTDFGVGTQVAGRDRTELEALIGLFINTVVLRTDLSGNPTFRELIARVRETVVQFVANQEVPFEKVIESINPPADPARNPLFQVNFICQRDFVRPLTFAGLRLTAVPSKSQGALYDLNVFLVERADGWRLSCEYDTDLFDKATANRVLANYRSLLEQVLKSPQKRISEFVFACECTAPATAEPEENSGEPNVPPETFALPASICQRRFWLLDRLLPGNPAFNMPVAMRLKGELDIGALSASVDQLIERHEALRTTFELRDGQLMQLVSSGHRTRVDLETLANVAENQREAETMRLLETYAREPFLLDKGPLLKVKLLRVAFDHHVLLLMVPHIISDGWSNGILVRELWSLYAARTRSTTASLPEVAIQYGDFAHWQNDWLQGRQAGEKLSYWTEQLSGPLPILNVPTDRPVTIGEIPKGGIRTLLLPLDLTAAMKEFCKREHATMFVLCLAAFKVLLHGYSGAEDILVGSPVANRSQDSDKTIGPFSNPVCLRTVLSGNPAFREILDRVRSAAFEALDNSELPIETILDNVMARSWGGRNSIFQFYFFYQVAFLQAIEAQNLVVTPLPTLTPGAAFEWQLGVIERPEGLRAELQYNADLYEPSTIDRVLDHFKKILESVVRDPEQAIEKIAFLTEDERCALAGWREMHPLTPARMNRREEFVAPRTAMERRIADIWEKTLQFKPISVTTSFFDLGGHSLQVAQLLREIELSLGRNLSLSSLFAAPTIAQMAAAAEQTQAVLPPEPQIESSPQGAVAVGKG
jgi:non-ribosomal peptide synthetase component F/NRPS condensation-like uncharacterized protein